MAGLGRVPALVVWVGGGGEKSSYLSLSKVTMRVGGGKSRVIVRVNSYLGHGCHGCVGDVGSGVIIRVNNYLSRRG